MKTRTTIHWLAGLAGALLLAVPVLFGAGRPTDPPPVDPPSQGDESQCEFLLEETQDELAECQASNVVFPGDGQTGAPLAYEEPDPPDGTFIDLNTGLMWEIKDGADSIEDYANPHDVDNMYTWSATSGGTDPDGTAFTEFLAELRGDLGGEPFAGYDDWRLPTVKELQSLVDYSAYYPAVSDELPGATDLTQYCSSTSYVNDDRYHWRLHFEWGAIYYSSKSDTNCHVRAVRGGW